MSTEKVELKRFSLFYMGDSGQNSEDQKADGNLTSKNQAEEIFGGKKHCIDCWTPKILCNVCCSVAERWSAYLLCPEILPET